MGLPRVKKRFLAVAEGELCPSEAEERTPDAEVVRRHEWRDGIERRPELAARQLVIISRKSKKRAAIQHGGRSDSPVLVPRQPLSPTQRLIEERPRLLEPTEPSHWCGELALSLIHI